MSWAVLQNQYVTIKCFSAVGNGKSKNKVIKISFSLVKIYWWVHLMKEM